MEVGKMAEQKPARVSKTRQSAKSKPDPKTVQDPKTPAVSGETLHLFWARELVQLARSEAAKKGVPDHVMAQAMLVNAWMLFTGQGERDARKSVAGLFTASMAKQQNLPTSS